MVCTESGKILALVSARSQLQSGVHTGKRTGSILKKIGAVQKNRWTGSA